MTGSISVPPQPQPVSRNGSLKSIPFSNEPIKLRNSGNDCYINSVLQIILNMPAFAEFIMQIDTTGVDEEWNKKKALIQTIIEAPGEAVYKNEFIEDIKRNAPLLKQKKIVRELQGLVAKKLLSKQNKDIALDTHLLATSVFGNSRQQDAREFYQVIRDAIEKNLSKEQLTVFKDYFVDATYVSTFTSKNKPTLIQQSDPLTSDIELIDIGNGGNFQTLISTSLEGSTEFSGDNAYQFSDGKKQDATQTRQYTKLPSVIVAPLKRWNEFKQKNSAEVNLPEELSLSVGSATKKYKLYGVVNHRGELNGGHYTTLLNAGMAHIDGYDKFLYASDENLGPIPLPTNSSEPYLYFYVEEGKEGEIFKRKIQVNQNVFEELQRELGPQKQSTDVEVDTDLDSKYIQALELEKQDMDGAIKIYKELAKQNHLDAMLRLADIYENGEGNIPEDQNKAFVYYELAAAFFEYSNVAICNLAHCYEDGIGVEIDKNKAFELYQQAAKLGNSFAKQHLAELNKQDSKHFSPVGYVEEDKPEQLKDFEFLHFFGDNEKEFYNVAPKEGGESNKNPDFVIVNAGNSSLAIGGDGLNGACAKLYGTKDFSKSDTSFKTLDNTKFDQTKGIGCIFAQWEDDKQTITHLYAVGPDRNKCKDNQVFFEQLKIANDAIFREITSHYAELTGKTIFFSGVSNNIFAGNLTDIKANIKGKIIEGANIVDYFNAFCFMHFIQKHKDELKKNNIHIYLNKSISVAVQALYNEQTCVLKLLNDNIKLEEKQKFVYNPNNGFELKKNDEEDDDSGDGGYGSGSEGDDGKPTDDKHKDSEETKTPKTTPKQPQPEPKPPTTEQPRSSKFKSAEKLPPKRPEEKNSVLLLSENIQNKINEIKAKTNDSTQRLKTGTSQQETRNALQAPQQIAESPQIKVLEHAKSLALIYENGEIFDTNIEFKNGEISPLKNYPEEAKQRLLAFKELCTQHPNDYMSITMNTKIEGVSETYRKKVLDDLFANEFLESAKKTCTTDKKRHDFEITRNVNTGILTIKVNGVGNFELPAKIQLGQVNEVMQAISDQNMTKLKTLGVETDKETSEQKSKTISDDRLQAIQRDAATSHRESELNRRNMQQAVELMV